MNRKRNVNYIKPEDPHFLKILKKEAGYDDVNHKFDKLQNSEQDFVEDKDSELPQVVVLSKGDLTAEEADVEKEKLEKRESESKADLNQRVVFKVKRKNIGVERNKPYNKSDKAHHRKETNKHLLSFTNNNTDNESE